MSSDQAAPGADLSELPPGLQFMRLLWELVHALDRASKAMTQSLGVTGPQRLVVRVLGLFPGISAGQLARILHIHPSTLTGILHRLSEHGLIERTAVSSDRRRARLRLTARGRRVNRVTQGTVEAAVMQVLRRSTGRDRAATQRLVAALSAELERQLGAAAAPRD